MNLLFIGIIGFYVIQNLAYTFWLKNLVIVDVIIIGVGFVLRVLAGCIAADLYLSPWLFTATFLIALMLGFSKRYSEMITTESAITHRPVLGEYNSTVLQGYLILSSTAARLYTSFMPLPEHIPIILSLRFRLQYMVFFHSWQNPSFQVLIRMIS